MEKKKKFQIPTTCALLFMLMIVCAVLTWIVPAGAYETEKVGNLNKVIAGTYHVIDSTPVGPWGVLMAVMAGFYKSAKLIFMIMFCGGAVAVLEKSGSINAAFGRLASNKKLNAHVLALLIMAFMSVGGAAGVFANPVVALVPIGIILATSLGYDAFTGFLFVYMGAYSGFNVGWANATTIGVAHPIAELPIFSGFEVRVLLNIINFAICYFFTVRYMKTIRKDPMKSLNYEEGMSVADFMGAKGETTETIHASMSWKHMVSLLGLVAAIAVIVIGSIKFSWSYDQMAATFFVLAVGCGLLNGMGVNGTTKEFINGCAKMTNAAFIVGFANGIGVILSQGQILNTIVNWLSIPISSMGSVMGANFMFIANLLINFLIPSGSGQAAAVMPLMVPIADLVGITRQVAVQAFPVWRRLLQLPVSHSRDPHGSPGHCKGGLGQIRQMADASSGMPDRDVLCHSDDPSGHWLDRTIRNWGSIPRNTAPASVYGRNLYMWASAPSMRTSPGSSAIFWMTKCAPAFRKEASALFAAAVFSLAERRSHSFSLNPSSELPSIIPTDQAPALTPSLMSDTVSPAFTMALTEESRSCSMFRKII